LLELEPDLVLQLGWRGVARLKWLEVHDELVLDGKHGVVIEVVGFRIKHLGDERLVRGGLDPKLLAGWELSKGTHLSQPPSQSFRDVLTGRIVRLRT